jgi:predicted neuraminidase
VGSGGTASGGAQNTGGASLGTGGTPGPTGTFSFTGTVVDFAGEPISGATVSLKNGGASTVAAADGSFTLSGGTASPGLVFNDSLVVSQTAYLDYQTLMYNQPNASGMVIRMASVDHPVYTRELLYEEGAADFPSCHASSIAELPDGTLLSVYFGGSGEGELDVEVRMSRKEPGQAWELPISIQDSPGSVENPVIFYERSGQVMVFWKITHTESYRIGMMKTSTDGGRTWGEARLVGDNVMGPEKNKPVQLEDGTILTPNADRNGWVDGGRLFCERSTNGGLTWENLSAADDGDLDAIQPTMFIHADGRLQMMARGSGKIPTTWSDDNGETWTTLRKTVLPANGSGIDAVTLRDGRQFLAYNHVPTPEGSKGNRYFLNLAVSSDGENWSAGLVLGICDGGQFSYPAIIQGRDGLVHVTHTWHRDTIAHIVVNPYKITQNTIVPMPNGDWPTSGPLSKDENPEKWD